MARMLKRLHTVIAHARAHRYRDASDRPDDAAARIPTRGTGLNLFGSRRSGSALVERIVAEFRAAGRRAA